MRRRTLFDLPAWWLRVTFWWQRAWFLGWCGVVGHRFVWTHRGDPVVGPLHVCSRCGKFERAN